MSRHATHRPFGAPGRLLLTALVTTAASVMLPQDLTGQSDYVPPLMRSAEYQRFELTLDKVRRSVRAAAELERLEREHPELGEAELENEEITLGGMAAMFEKYPAALGVLEREGTNPREYTLTMIAVANAMGALMLRAAGMEPPPVPESHLKFVEENRAELERLMGPIIGGEGPPEG